MYPGKSAWHFVTLPEADAREIETNFAHLQRGWSSFKVKISVGKTQWQTSIFKDKKANSYLLPIKKDVRIKEKIMAGDELVYTLEILE